MKQDLRSIPFFSELPAEVITALEGRCRREHYRNGELVFAEGDFGDRLYVIETGQVKVLSERDGREQIFAYLNPGNFFGETAVLTGDARSASVRVVLDSDLVSLSKSDVEELIRVYPPLAMQITRELGRRLSRTSHRPVQAEEKNLVAVVGPGAIRLAQCLAETTGEDVFVLDLGGLADTPCDQAALARAGVLMARGAAKTTPEDLPSRLGALVQEYYWILISIPGAPTPVGLKAIDLADATVHFMDKAEPWLAQAAGDAYWSMPARERAFGRAARRLARRQVGVALSSGSARGLAHIGVLKVFDQENLPVDYVAATSMGAIVGALYCAGCPSGEIIQIAEMMERQTNVLKGFSMWDFALPPRSGVLRGNKTLEYFRKILGNRKFQDLETPLSIVAADVISGEEVILDRGPVAEAVRASMSIIGVFEPAHVGDRYLIDGGAVNPVPNSVLADRGLDIVVASSVIPGLRERLHRRQLLQSGRPPNVVNILMGTMEIMESEIIKTRTRPIEVLIQPDIARFTTLDYSKAHEIIAAGEEAARRQVDRLRRLLAPRPRPRPGN